MVSRNQPTVHCGPKHLEMHRLALSARSVVAGSIDGRVLHGALGFRASSRRLHLNPIDRKVARPAAPKTAPKWSSLVVVPNRYQISKLRIRPWVGALDQRDEGVSLTA